MRDLPAGLQDHLNSGATTMCWCWKIVRRDGAVRGFTDHDRDLTFDETLFEASTGFTSSEIKESVGLSIDNLEVDSVLTSENLNEADLAAGLYDDAHVEIYRANWQDVTQRVLMRSGSIGEIRRGQTAFTAEIRGLAHYLQQPKGRVYQFGCDAVLGDDHFRVDLSQSDYKATGTILRVLDRRTFEVSGLSTFPEDWFSRGLLTWESGANSGQSIEIKLHSVTGNQVTLEIWQAMSRPIEGLAYIVFERLPLARFGNRIPQLNFEVFRALDDFEQTVRGVTMLPGSGEFVYETNEIVREGGIGVTVSENVNTRSGGSDWNVSMNDLTASLPNAISISLIVSWFGTDLRCSNCEVKPGVDEANKVTSPDSWSVAGVARESAYLVTRYNGKPAYGGTPSDKSVVSALKDLKSRGMRVLFYPFLLMDVPHGNSLTDPWSGEATQPAYPWRGRVTVNPAPGRVGSPDKSPAVNAQIATFLGSAQIGDFDIQGERVLYSGPSEWSWRRMILHYAHLCKAAGGVDGFLIGSELRGLTWVRDSDSTYPFVDALKSLAGDVKAILGAETDVTYAADWSEYFGHHPTDGSNDVYFHLDPLWSSPNIDAIAIDCYWPLSDWRNGENHLDYLAGTKTIYDLSYLKSHIAGGEGFDWYYRNSEDRDSQTRTEITDGLGKPWVFRFKDIKGWWHNHHFNRPGGIESSTATDWVPESKPIWFTETGCPAVDKGANQPNVFYDPKSSESALPYYSNGVRDDLVQRRYLQAFYDFFDANHPEYVADSNPASSQFAGRMVDLDNLYSYTWDARPYPAFPFKNQLWGDASNWPFGHWLTGRVSGVSLAETVATICNDFCFHEYDVSGLSGLLSGYVVDNIMSARSALQQLELSYFFDSFESNGLIRFAHRGREGSIASLEPEKLVDEGNGGELYEATRSQETDLPQVAKINYIEGSGDYRQATVEARRIAGASGRTSTIDLPVVLGQDQIQAIADSWLQDSWMARERTSFVLPPSKLAVEPSDLVTLLTADREFLVRITEVADRGAREVSALTIDPRIYEYGRTPSRALPLPPPLIFGPALVAMMDLPLLRGDELPHAGYVAAYQSPWPGSVAFYRSPEESGFSLKALAEAPATIGETESDFYSGPHSRWDYGNKMRVRLNNGTLQSVTELGTLDGGNAATIKNQDGEWEVLQFQKAELIDNQTYELSIFLRGQVGTELAMRDPIPAGAQFVLLDQAVSQIDMTADEIGTAYYWKFGPSNRTIDHRSYTSLIKSFSGRGLKPLSPVHVTGFYSGQDIVISWIRRTRFGGDSWDITEIPLNEEAELYEVDILDGSQVVRTLTASAPSAIYSEADQLADFGGLQNELQVAVFQVAGGYGRGTAKEATLSI